MILLRGDRSRDASKQLYEDRDSCGGSREVVVRSPRIYDAVINRAGRRGSQSIKVNDLNRYMYVH